MVGVEIAIAGCDDVLLLDVGVGGALSILQFGIAAGESPVSVIAEDFNEDGVLDLAVANAVSNGSVSVLIGMGDAGFAQPISYGVGSSPMKLFSADLNGDLSLDLVTANDGVLSWLPGNGDGTFANEILIQTGTGSLFADSIVVAEDFNNDGATDLAAPLESGDISILLGNGKGAFDELQIITGANQVCELSSGDFDNDGRMDLASIVAVGNDDRLWIFNGLGSGLFSQPSEVSVFEEPLETLATGDFNNDNFCDLALSDEDARLVLLTSDGNGSFVSTHNVVFWLEQFFISTVNTNRYRGFKR